MAEKGCADINLLYTKKQRAMYRVENSPVGVSFVLKETRRRGGRRRRKNEL